MTHQGRDETGLSSKEMTEIQAAVLRRLLAHLDKRTDVQNIDLMILAGFCRNCLARWVGEEASARGIAIGKEAAREAIYGMPYEVWKRNYQRDANPEQIRAFEALDEEATS